ncbi:MAG: ABC transporter substrate-binding protein [Oscillospiraceae bacterium]|nr:ABC transporter substrate-binding protein [Oscillospiraceae bacterium]
MRRILSVLLCAALLLLVAASCGEEEGLDGTFSYPIDTMPECLDPAIASSPEELTVLANLTEGLVTLGAKDGKGAATEILPAAAERWSVSADKKTYTFHLKQAAWHFPKAAAALLQNATAAKTAAADASTEKTTLPAPSANVTAQDFVFALRRVLNPATKSPYAGLLTGIKELRAPDAQTLVIELLNPSADFLNLMAMPFAAPVYEPYFAATAGAYGLDLDYLATNGPFTLNRWDENSLRLVRSSGYTGARVCPASVTLKQEAITTMRLLGAEGGYSIIRLPSDSTLAKGFDWEDAKASVYTIYTGTKALVANTASSPLSDAALRTALMSSAVSAANATLDFLPPSLRLGGSTYRHEAGSLAVPATDAAAAKAAVTAAAGKAGTVSLELLCRTRDAAAAKQLVQSVQNIFGLTVSLSVRTIEEDKDFSNAVQRGNFTLAIADVQMPSSIAAAALAALCAKDSASNLARLPSYTYDAQLRKAAAAESEKAAAASYAAAEKTLFTAGAYVTLGYTQDTLFLAEGVDGLVFAPAGEMLYFRGLTFID